MKHPFQLAHDYWQARFRKAMENKIDDEAKDFYQRMIYWKRRIKLEETLTEICDRKEMKNGRE